MASRFWVGGTGTWDSSTTTHWAASSGGAGGVSVPGASDDVTFDGSSGGGTVTVNFGGTVTILTLTMGAFTGTWDNSVNNNNITMTAAGGFNGGGAGTRTITLGSATYTISSTTGSFSINTTTGLTFSGASATIAFTGGGGTTRTFSCTSSNLTFGTLTLGASTGASRYQINGPSATGLTFGTVNITAPNYIEWSPSGTTPVYTITNAVNWQGTATQPIVHSPAGTSVTAVHLSIAGGATIKWNAFRAIIFDAGSPTATDSFDLNGNSGITINAPGGTGTSLLIGGQFFSAGFF